MGYRLAVRGFKPVDLGGPSLRVDMLWCEANQAIINLRFLSIGLPIDSVISILSLSVADQAIVL